MENKLTPEIMQKVLNYAFDIVYYNPSMGMDMICEYLNNKFDIDARFNATSCYIDGERVFSVEFSHEGPSNWAVYKIRTYKNKDLKKVYDLSDVTDYDHTDD